MKQYIFIFVSVICLYSCNTEDIKVYDLRCENLTDPLGIDTEDARFSWKIKSDIQGDRQTAYRILVASSSTLLAADKADLWDSGEIESPESVLTPYSGARLSSGTVAFWKVRIKNKNGHYSTWSKPAKFSIGLLNLSDWQGIYIGFPKEAGDPQSPLLRKQFELKSKSGCILLHINSLGYHEVYINGGKIGNELLVPAVSQFNKRSLSRTYDVSNCLKKGKNDLVIWLGRGWYQLGLPGVVYEGPLVKAQLEEYGNSMRNILLVTDTSWNVCESGYSLTKKWKYDEFGGEHIDATLVPDNFTAPELDKRQWHLAVKIDVPTHTVSPQMTEGNRIAEKYPAKSIIQIADKSWLVDVGKSLTGQIEVKFPKLSKEQKITLAYCDHIDDKGNFVNQNQEDYYIASGKAGEIFQNKFNYHSFRYLKISGLEEAPHLDDITAFLIRTGYDDAASFRCSDDDMNAIHDMIRHTLHSLSLGGYLVDCHHFERLGYGGDGHASTVTAQTLFNLPSLYANWLQAWGDCIRDDGGLPHTAPNPYPAGGGPYWCAFIVTSPWNAWLNYGDRRFIEKYYLVMQHWLQYVDKYTVDRLLKKWPDTDYRSWYLGDWLPPKRVDQSIQASIDLVNNCTISECYVLLRKMAHILGKENDASLYANKRDTLNKLLHEIYFQPDSAGYASNSQIDIAYPMLTQVTPPELTDAVMEKLLYETEHTLKGHIGTGLVGIPVITEWVVKFNQPDFMYSMLKKTDYPGYLYMINNGATTTWEAWDEPRSYIHNCFNGIGSWFYQAVGGIRPDETAPAYRKVWIQPQIPEGITWAEIIKETPYGTLSVHWEKNSVQLSFNLSIPVGCTAYLPLPKKIRRYSINGENFNKIDTTPLILESGKYKVIY
ncbi:MAG: glycoside hydrolase family 78 protein [Tannerella sp.]|jgi:alpha-L-rhamnosidase|nr:glycoside hydrolase family 78 protein [Tannerella sp.]